MRFSKRIIALFIMVVATTGCGETARGMGRDVSRIGYGVKTIFVSH